MAEGITGAKLRIIPLVIILFVSPKQIHRVCEVMLLFPWWFLVGPVVVVAIRRILLGRSIHGLKVGSPLHV